MITQANDNQFVSHAEYFSILWPVLNAKRKETRRKLYLSYLFPHKHPVESMVHLIFKPLLPESLHQNLVQHSAEHLAGRLIMWGTAGEQRSGSAGHDCQVATDQEEWGSGVWSPACVLRVHVTWILYSERQIVQSWSITALRPRQGTNLPLSGQTWKKDLIFSGL